MSMITKCDGCSVEYNPQLDSKEPYLGWFKFVLQRSKRGELLASQNLFNYDFCPNCHQEFIDHVTSFTNSKKVKND